jgi:putative ABC transport system permease protein
MYIWRNVTRNKVRTALTILSVGFSLALLTVLFGFIVMQGVWRTEAEKYNRLVVMNSMGFAGRVPISYVDEVRQIEGVKAAVQYSWFGGEYKDETFPFAQFGTDPQHVFQVWDEFTIDPEQLKSWQANRQGCVVDRRLAEKRGWKIGEKIPLKGTYFPYDLDLQLCGVFDTPQPIDSLWFNWEYLNEGLKQVSSRATEHAGTIFAKTIGPDVMPGVIKGIDERYASSDNPTRSQTEAAFAQMFTDMLGNIQTYIRNIGLAVFFALSLVAGNSMAMAMRERTTEIAVLKAVGFSRGRVLGMVLGESCVISLIGGALGIVAGCLFLNVLHNLSPQFFQFRAQDILGMWIVYMISLAAGLGLVSGIFPAVRAARLSVVNGLRRVI